MALQGHCGTVMRLPAAGTEIAVGRPRYEFDGHPVIAARGDVLNPHTSSTGNWSLAAMSV